MKHYYKSTLGSVTLLAAMMVSPMASATSCESLPDYSAFTDAVDKAYDDTSMFGFGFVGMWATLVDTTGKVCHVYSVDGDFATPNGGADAGNTAWLGSRVISAQKANTANAFSLDEFAISTGAISVAVYPGGSLYGLQHSNPVDPAVAYRGSPQTYGTQADPLKNKRIGGINVFGGGVALYDGVAKVGAVGVSGDSSCRDHSMAYRLRYHLGLDYFPNDDALSFVAEPAGLFQQPICNANDPTGEDNGVVPPA